ncbi:hypothetical protein Tsubulata_043329 [Turnera subulata]|uniref:DUF632 domain-containing protein n=1 Tax=Turnera subulata TaxID=218843 RepID=A0A9Q0JBP6_9ROSI|nr:hypothetical protein Tsubulata_043329 [Turnera subulata]
MGCNQSKIENEEAVSRCKERKQHMKEAVSSRNAFAAAHVAHAMSLKNTGAALSDYASSEFPYAHHPSSALPSSSSLPSSSTTLPPAAADEAPLPPPPLTTVLPPPPPLEFQPLQRAASMPEMKIQKKDGKKTAMGPTINEEEDDELLAEDMEFEMQDNEKLVRKRSSSRGGNKDSSNSSSSSIKRGGGDDHGNRHVDRGPQQPQPQLHPEHDAAYDFFFGAKHEHMTPNLPEPEEEEVVVPPGRKAVVEELEEVVEEEEQEVKLEKRVREQVERVVEEEEKVEVPVSVAAPPPPAVEKKGSGGGRRGIKGMNLMQIFTELDDHFLKASESAHEVSKMLEATRLHYHSNFADNRGHIDHSARVMRVITWNRSFKGIPNVDDGKDDFDTEEHETHATVLDKMLAWEKKLYDEVKAGELMKFEYQRKVTLLNKQKKRNVNPESLEKLKAAVSHLHTRYIVDMQSMDSTVAEINRLRDEQLYPKLVQLVDGMALMWDTMRVHHEAQSKIVNALRTLDISHSPKETSEHHHERTFQLLVVVQEWHSQFGKLIDNQKAYIKALNNWLKLNLIPIESSLKEKVSSPPRVSNPPIQTLLMAWHDFIDKLPDELARTAINNFGAVIHTILQHQEEEMKLKEKCDETRKELARKTRQFEDWYHKYMQRRTPEELDPEGPEANIVKDAIEERQLVVDLVKKRLEEEEEEYQKQCLQVREKSLASLKTRLPELFRAVCDVAQACSEMYRNLRSISQRRNPR